MLSLTLPGPFFLAMERTVGRIPLIIIRGGEFHGKWMFYIVWIITVAVVFAIYPELCMVVLKIQMFSLMLASEAAFFAVLYREGSTFWLFRWLNPAIVGLGIPMVFQLYSPDSFKPGWLDWLG